MQAYRPSQPPSKRIRISAAAAIVSTMASPTTKDSSLADLEHRDPDLAEERPEERASGEGVDTDPNGDSGNTNIVSWDGPLDPENPMNWPKVQKCINIGLMSLLTIIS